MIGAPVAPVAPVAPRVTGQVANGSTAAMTMRVPVNAPPAEAHRLAQLRPPAGAPWATSSATAAVHTSTTEEAELADLRRLAAEHGVEVDERWFGLTR